MGQVGQEIVGEDRERIIEMLNQGVAAELNDAYRYLLLSKYAEGIYSGEVAAFFARTAQGEWNHLQLLIDRILQLGGTPMESPADATGASYTDYSRPPEDPTDVRTMLEDSLRGERAAIRFWKALFDLTRETDPVTNELAREGIADEVGDEDELERLLAKGPWGDGA